VAIHAPGFLQCFECGPFRLADAKGGILEIPVPRPAALELSFDPAVKTAGKAPFKGASLQVIWHVPGTSGSYLVVANRETASATDMLRLTDLAPGHYQASVRTEPKQNWGRLLGLEINPGAYYDGKELTLAPGQSESFHFHYQPFDPNIFRGDHTVVLHICRPDGTPAAGRRVKVEYFDGHYGSLQLFSGAVPESGKLVIQGLTDRVVHAQPERAYSVKVDEQLLDYFSLTTDKKTQEFRVQVPVRVGDLAPDVELRTVTNGSVRRLSSFRGKVVCLEFWATWCGPCQAAMAKLNQLCADHAADWKGQVAILAVSIDATPEQAKSHVGQRGWNHPEHFWAGAITGTAFAGPAARAFGVSGVPEAVLIGPNGRILWRGHPLDNHDGLDLRSRIETACTK
jgi:thiol-disulfide isomerase/thioredoxin